MYKSARYIVLDDFTVGNCLMFAQHLKGLWYKGLKERIEKIHSGLAHHLFPHTSNYEDSSLVFLEKIRYSFSYYLEEHYDIFIISLFFKFSRKCKPFKCDFDIKTLQMLFKNITNYCDWTIPK